MQCIGEGSADLTGEMGGGERKGKKWAERNIGCERIFICLDPLFVGLLPVYYSRLMGDEVIVHRVEQGCN